MAGHLLLLRSTSAKIFMMSGYVFCVSSHFYKAYTDAVHLPRFTSWVRWYICSIFSGTIPQRGHRLVDACTCICKIVVVDRLLLIHFVLKCDTLMQSVIVSPGFLCWGDLVFSEFQNQFCAWSAQSGQKFEPGSLFNAKMLALLPVGDFVKVRGTDKFYI